ncbi:MAG: ABC transporter ATP-binding protein, partial [Firmicutes bacterium]|nr:ABC transporter ATP-binding protein [Bacillota bacterium]
EAVADAKGISDQPVYIGIRPEGFELSSEGTLTCNLSRVEVMGRDISVISTHKDAETEAIRSIIDADNLESIVGATVKFEIKPHKILIFNKETEERIYIGE